ncbi:MAG: hypothetical protein A2W31_04950 [Planctomycetes bacterium RBG_16_64_10]|nr:MAG: hypothetical protein A2W31_04950 [Planctomycetes bacterium RBG_16_64_10]
MTQLRFDPPQRTLLLDVPWEVDRQFRMNPQVVTALLQEQVPVLRFVNWSITLIERGRTESVLPLNAESTNQHVTHQAALFLLAADYTGGTALASLLSGWPVIGVHPVSSDDSVSLWLVKSEVKYARPSVTDLRVTACIDPQRFARICKRFAAGKAVIESIPIECRNGDLLVAEGETTYYARQSQQLRTMGVDHAQVHTLYQLKLTSSAELIAGVRARENGELFYDPYAEAMAGQHGMALAARFCERSPQLGGMVAARTWHLDSHLSHFLAAGGRDIVIVGVGWDMRSFRLDLPPGTRVFELDLPPTLGERRRRLAQLAIEEPAGVTRTEIAIDLRTMSLAAVMREHVNPDARVFIAWEGMSMYFAEAEVIRILQGMLPLLKHRDSQLWCDFVSRDAIERPAAYGASVREFMRGMQILGEPFRFGVDSVGAFMKANGFGRVRTVTSDVCLRDKDDPVYSIYVFCVAEGPATVADAPHAPRQLAIDKGWVVPPPTTYTRVAPAEDPPTSR